MNGIRGLTTVAASLAVIALSSSPTVRAEDMTYSGLASRIRALEAGRKSQQVQLASCDSDCTGEPSCGCSTCCKSSCCACPAFFIGYELTVLQPYISEHGTGVPFDDEFGFGHRLTAGYDGGSGMGARARYWFYNHGHDILTGMGSSVGIDMDVLDLEVNFYEQLRNFDLMISGGARYGRAELTSPGTAFGFGGDRFFFEGIGPTAALETTREFGDRGMYFIGNVRAALLFGDIHEPAFGPKAEDDTTLVFESQLGVGMTRDLGGATLNLRSVWETQVWRNDALTQDLGTSLGFGGPTSSVELRY